MKIVELHTGLFPDAQTVSAALRQAETTHRVESIDLAEHLRRQEAQTEFWDRAIAAILESDLTITL